MQQGSQVRCATHCCPCRPQTSTCWLSCSFSRWPLPAGVWQAVAHLCRCCSCRGPLAGLPSQGCPAAVQRHPAGCWGACRCRPAQRCSLAASRHGQALCWPADRTAQREGLSSHVRVQGQAVPCNVGCRRGELAAASRLAQQAGLQLRQRRQRGHGRGIQSSRGPGVCALAPPAKQRLDFRPALRLLPCVHVLNLYLEARRRGDWTQVSPSKPLWGKCSPARLQRLNNLCSPCLALCLAS